MAEGNQGEAGGSLGKIITVIVIVAVIVFQKGQEFSRCG